MAQGVSRVSVGIFFSYSAEKISGLTLLCPVSEIFRQPKNLWIRGGGSFMFFCRKNFFSQCRKIQQGNPSVLCSRKLLVAKIFMDKKGGISRVSNENFLSVSAKNFRCGTLQCVINFGYRKILCFRGLCNDFLSKNFRLTVPKNQEGKPSMLCFTKFPVAKKIIDRKEGEVSSFSFEIFFCLTVSKNAVGVSFSLSIISAKEKFWKRR